MKITRTSKLTGVTRTRELPIIEAQLKVWQDGMLIQAAMPNLNDNQREFIKTGITEEEWADLFGPAYVKGMMNITEDKA